MSALKHLQDFVSLKRKLCLLLLEEYSHITDWELLLDLPKKGEVTADGDVWSYTKHGSGVLFLRSRDGLLIDAPQKISEMQSHLDAWSLSSYFESMNIGSLVYKKTTYSADERDLKKLLLVLEADGLVTETGGTYILAPRSETDR